MYTVPGRSDGKSWKETVSVRFFTPSAYAFAIWCASSAPSTHDDPHTPQ